MKMNRHRTIQCSVCGTDYRARTEVTDQTGDFYFHDDRVSPWKDTAFGIVQAFNTWDQHTKSTKGDTVRAERNMLAALDGSIERSDGLVLAAISGMGFGQDLALAPLS